MGSCFSLAPANSNAAPKAKIIALNGSLKEYSVRVTVSSVLGLNHRSCFPCSSDSLYFDTLVPQLASDFVLELNQICFVLPIAKRDYLLSSSGMAPLAGKAGSALACASKKKKKKNDEGRRIRVTPIGQVIWELDRVEAPCATLVKNSIIGKRSPRVRS